MSKLEIASASVPAMKAVRDAAAVGAIGVDTDKIHLNIEAFRVMAEGLNPTVIWANGNAHASISVDGCLYICVFTA